MRPPRIPPMVTDIIQTAICALDGVEFTSRASCPYCGGPAQGYDSIQRKYAVIRDEKGARTITVRIRRFTCRDCRRLCNADEPFYPGTRIGSLVVDLFFTLSTSMPESRAARIIETMGIGVNRTSWKNYAKLQVPEIPVANIFGMILPSSALTLSTLAARLPEGCCIEGAEVLAACGFPSAYQAVPDVSRSRQGRSAGGEPEKEEERQAGRPE